MLICVYILACADRTFYTGITSNLKRRLWEHQNGFSSFTKGRLPINLVYYEAVEGRVAARRREVLIKDMSQKKKQVLINKFTSSVSEKRR